MKTLPLVFATLLTSSIVGVAHAATPAAEIRQRVVSFADLDLRQNADTEKLYLRIRRAARSVCGTPGVQALALTSLYHQCARQAITRAIEYVDVPALTRYHVAQGATATDAGTQTALLQRD